MDEIAAILVIIGVIGVALCFIIPYILIYTIPAEKEQKIEFDKKSLELYKQCCKEYVQSLNTEASLSKLKSVALRFNITDIDTAKQYYIRGQELAEEEQRQENLKRATQEREIEIQFAKKEEKDAELIGRNKYIGYAEYLKNTNKGLSALTELATSRNPRYEKQESTLGAAAKGSFLGGPAMGIANAMRVESKNNSRLQRQHEYDEEIKEAKEKSKSLLDEAKKYEYEIEKFDQNHIIEYKDTDIYEKFEALNFSNIVCSFTCFGNINIEGKIKLTKSFEIYDIPAKLDGSLKIKVLDENERTVGYAYYCANGKDKMDINKIGFQTSDTLSAICIPIVNDLNPETSTLHCEIYPYYLWTIAKIGY